MGHIVTAEGVKVEAVTTWPKPFNLKTLRSFLGFCGYYRRFIHNYSSIVRPLTDLTKGYGPTQRGRKSTKRENNVYLDEREPFGERWDESCSEAFEKIKDCLTNTPVLAFADPGKPYTLHVDASLLGTWSCFISGAPGRAEASRIREQKTELFRKELCHPPVRVPVAQMGSCRKISRLSLWSPFYGAHRQQPSNLCPFISEAQRYRASMVVRFVSV